jgi:hypothetical protein
LSLIKQGVSHNLAWYADQALNVREIASDDDLQIVLPELLSARVYADLPHAIGAYIESEFINQRLAPIYVTTVLSPDKMSEVSVRQPLKSYYITDKITPPDDIVRHLDMTTVSIRSDERIDHA